MMILRITSNLFPLFLCLVLAACEQDPPRRTEPAPTPSAPAQPPAKSPDADGMQEIFDQDGSLLMRGNKMGGQRHGDWESYYPDGSIRSRATFINGLQQGPTTVYHETGAVFYTGTYKDGQAVGEWTFFDEEGTPVKLVRYSMTGELLEQKEL
jgi:hypothetical protein